MAGIWSVLDAVQAEAAMARLHDLAGSHAAPGDDRLIGERAADALVGCVLGSADSNEKGRPARRAAGSSSFPGTSPPVTPTPPVNWTGTARSPPPSAARSSPSPAPPWSGSASTGTAE
jgi:hypothetical protein